MTEPYVSDYTAIVHRRGRMAKASDINLTGLPGGGLDLKAAGAAAGIAAAVGAVAFLPWQLYVPLTPWMLVPLGILLAAPLYWLFQRETEGRESILQSLQLAYLRRFRQPQFVAGMASDTEPTHFQWEVIVARDADADPPVLAVRQYEHYGYNGDQLAEPVQGRMWPAFDESVGDWQYRAWWESGGQLIDQQNQGV